MRSARSCPVNIFERLGSLLMAVALLLVGSFATPSSGKAEVEFDSPPLGELLPKVFLAYGGRENFAQMDKNYLFIGEQKITLPDTGQSSVAQFRQLRKGACFRIDLESGEAPVSTVFDGVSAWKSSGKVVTELPGDAARLLAQERDREPSVLVHFQEQPYTLKLLGLTTYRASPVYAIEVTRSGQPAVTVFVDQRNYLVDGISYEGIDPAGGAMTAISVDFLEYRPSGGTMVPFKQIQYVKDKPYLELTLSSADLTSAVEDCQFQRPDRPYDVRLSKDVAIPFEYSHKEILVKVRLNGSEPLDFLFDTGATQTVIDRRTAAENFLDKQGNFNVTGVTGPVTTQMTAVRKFELGDSALADVQALILDLMPQTRQMGKHICGIVGENVLNRFAVTIDFSKCQIVLHDAATYKPPAAAAAVSFAQRQGPVVKASLNGTTELSFLVDTGAAFNNLPAKTASLFLAGQTPHMTEGTGLDGRPVRLATIALGSVKLGGQTVKQVNFTYSVEQDSRLQSRGFIQSSNIGVLGNPFWQNFILTLDYKFRRLILQPNSVVTARQDLEQLLVAGDAKLNIYRDLRAAESAYQRALTRVQSLGDPRQQARVWGRMGNLRRVMAKDLMRPEQARIAYEYFSKGQELAHKLEDREIEGRILADWALLYIDNGQMPAARQALEGAMLYAPQDPQVNVDFGVYLYKLQSYSEMQKYIEKALFLEPANWQALWYEVKLWELFGDPQKLKETLKEIIRLYPWSKLARDKLTALTSPLIPSPTPSDKQ